MILQYHPCQQKYDVDDTYYAYMLVKLIVIVSLIYIYAYKNHYHYHYFLCVSYDKARHVIQYESLSLID